MLVDHDAPRPGDLMRVNGWTGVHIVLQRDGDIVVILDCRPNWVRSIYFDMAYDRIISRIDDATG